MTSTRRGRLVAVAAAVLGILVALVAAGTGAVDRVENDAVDARFATRDAPTPSDIVVVAIDEATISRLGRWPFSRHHHADAVERLDRAGAKLIVYDVQFTEPSPDDSADNALYDAVASARGVVLATSTSAPDGSTDVLGGDEWLARAHARAGAANLPAQEGGIRHYERLTGRLPALAVVAAEQLGHEVGPERFEDGRAWIDFRGGPGTFETVSFADLVKGDVPAERLRGKVVVVGATAPTLQDLHPTPTSSEHEMSGPEIQANAIWTATHGNPLRDAPAWVNLLAIVLLALLPPAALAGRRFLMTLSIASGLGAAWAALAVWLFSKGLVVAVVAPLVALVTATVAAVVGGALVEAAERRRVSRENARLEALVEERTRKLNDAYREIVRRLAIAAESRDDETGGHIERLSQLTHRLALAIGLSEEEADTIRHASLMHDIGKIAVPDDVLRKPGSLSGEEWAIMRNHTLAGAHILEGSESPLVQMAEVIARTHHEKWDGSGYPQGLKGEEIPLAGRITAVCDVFDALVSARHYKAAWKLHDALAELKRQRGVYFDPELVNAFVDMVPELPKWLLTGGRDADQILRRTAQQAPAQPAQPMPHLKLVEPAPEPEPDPDGVPPLHATRPR